MTDLKPWCVPAGDGNEHVICEGDDPSRPGRIIFILRAPSGSADRERCSYEFLAEQAALIVRAVNAYSAGPAERPTNSDACEAIARMLVPYWYGGFELQDVDRETGVWRKPPGTPNDRAYEIADKVLAIVGRSSPAEKEMEASDAPVWYGPDEASAWANGYNSGAARRSQPASSKEEPRG